MGNADVYRRIQRKLTGEILPALLVLAVLALR